jgi:hypothetical protein
LFRHLLGPGAEQDLSARAYDDTDRDTHGDANVHATTGYNAAKKQGLVAVLPFLRWNRCDIVWIARAHVHLRDLLSGKRRRHTHFEPDEILQLISGKVELARRNGRWNFNITPSVQRRK